MKPHLTAEEMQMYGPYHERESFELGFRHATTYRRTDTDANEARAYELGMHCAVDRTLWHKRPDRTATPAPARLDLNQMKALLDRLYVRALQDTLEPEQALDILTAATLINDEYQRRLMTWQPTQDNTKALPLIEDL